MRHYYYSFLMIVKQVPIIAKRTKAEDTTQYIPPSSSTSVIKCCEQPKNEVKYNLLAAQGKNIVVDINV